VKVFPIALESSECSVDVDKIETEVTVDPNSIDKK